MGRKTEVIVLLEAEKASADSSVGNSALHWCWQYVVCFISPALGYMFGGSLDLYVVYQLESLWQIS